MEDECLCWWLDGVNLDGKWNTWKCCCDRGGGNGIRVEDVMKV